MMAQTACDMHRTLFPFFSSFIWPGEFKRQQSGKWRSRVAESLRQSPGESSLFFRIKKGHSSSSMQMLIIGREEEEEESACVHAHFFFLLLWIKESKNKKRKDQWRTTVRWKGPGPYFLNSKFDSRYNIQMKKKKPLIPINLPAPTLNQIKPSPRCIISSLKKNKITLLYKQKKKQKNEKRMN
jgi:hypothetical protein